MNNNSNMNNSSSNIALSSSSNNNNNNSLLNRNKSHSIIGLHSSKYESSLKDNYSAKNVNLKNQLLNGGIKSDTYESVCPPEDVAERTKQTHKNSMIRNNLADASSNNNTSGSINNISNMSNMNGGNQSSRNLKRVSSAPPMQNLAVVNGPPPPPLPPPLRTPVQQQRNNLSVDQPNSMTGNNGIYKKNVFGPNQGPTNANGTGGAAPPPVPAPNPVATEAVDSDSGLEVVEEPSLRPSELVRGNHNRTMSTISANKKAKLLNAGSTNGSSIAASSEDSQSRFGGSVHAANGSAANAPLFRLLGGATKTRGAMATATEVAAIIPAIPISHTTRLASRISTRPACTEEAPPPRITTNLHSSSSRSTEKPTWSADRGRADPIWSTSSWCCLLCRPVFPINHKTASRISSSRPSISRASASTSVRVHPPPGE
ncbi:GD15701 [Drosophila simulans]|uniref:GD15701 n=1 Tax=Drosophila simulans TaxID=7240 RepID=B4R6C7_DROSI|nr:GD15701 [Drosophila simulans]